MSGRTAQPPDPDPENTPGLEPGGSVRPGDTPPESGQTSGLSHTEPGPQRTLSALHVAVAVLFVLMLVVIIGALALRVLGVW